MLSIWHCSETMNTDWFRQKLSERKLSQRGLAKLLDLDPAAVSLMLRGQRKMTTKEAHEIANLIGMPVTEVLRQAGIDVLDDVRRVPISASCDEAGTVTLFPDTTHDHVIGPADCPTGTYAVQCRANAPCQDGWLLFVSPARPDPMHHLDKLCMLATTKGKLHIACVRRGYRSGTFNLVLWPSRDVLHDESIAWCSPVLWVKP